MSPIKPNPRKAEHAERVLTECTGQTGMWASPHQFRYQCKTRDFVLGVLPLLMQRKKTHVEIARRHLLELIKRQRVNGQIPALFLDNRVSFFLHEVSELMTGKTNVHTLTRYIRSNEWNLAPHIADSEILFAIGLHEYDLATSEHDLLLQNNKVLTKALRFVEYHLSDDMIIRGCDWREAEYTARHNQHLLFNSVLLFHAHKAMHSQKAHHAKQRIHERFWNGSHYQMATNEPTFDPLATSLGVIYEAIGREHYASVTQSLREQDSQSGIITSYKPNPISKEERVVIDRSDGTLLFPFAMGFAILALLKMREYTFAEEQFRKLNQLRGFHAWYDPQTGKGYGTKDELMHAALYLRVLHAFEHHR